MEETPQIGGSGHRFAVRDYYENVEISEERLWHLPDEELAAEDVRCQAKLTQARRNIRPLKLTLWLLAGIIGIGLLMTFSVTQQGWPGFLFAIVWVIGMLFVPLRRFLQNAEFEGVVIKHYINRLQLIRLIKRDRA